MTVQCQVQYRISPEVDYTKHVITAKDYGQLNRKIAQFQSHADKVGLHYLIGKRLPSSGEVVYV